MPSQQPNENMDQALKAYAQKRRDDAPQMELDLPTRNMLQAEVARTLAPVPVPVAAKARPRFAWWPQIIMGVAGCAAVAIAVILWPSSPSPSTSTAKVTTYLAPVTVDATTPAAPAAVTAASAPAPDATLTVSASDVAKTEAPKEESTFYNWTTGGVFSNSAPISLGIASDTGVVAETDRFRDDAIFKDGIDKDRSLVVQNGGTVTDSFNFNSLDSTNSFGLLGSREPSPALAKSFDAPVSSPVPAAMPAPTLTAQARPAELADQSKAAEKKEVAGAIIANNAGQQVPHANLRFFRIENRGQYRRNLNSPPLPKVLTNFAVQRNGSNVSVRDADGSLYNGNIILDAEAAVLNGGKVSGYGGALPVLQNGNNMPEDTFAFRVSGYNGKLKQKIVFTGNVTNVVIVTNPIAVGYVQQNETRAQNSSQNLNAPQQQSPQQNLLLNGRVQVGRNTEFEIQAAPTK